MTNKQTMKCIPSITMNQNSFRFPCVHCGIEMGITENKTCLELLRVDMSQKLLTHEERFDIWQEKHADETWQGYYHESFQEPLKAFINQELKLLLTDIVGKKQTLDFKQFGGIYEAVSLENIQKIGEEWGLTIPTESSN